MDLKSAAKRILARVPNDPSPPVPTGPHKEILDFISHFRNQGTMKHSLVVVVIGLLLFYIIAFYEEGVIYYHPVDNHFAWYSFYTKKII